MFTGVGGSGVVIYPPLVFSWTGHPGCSRWTGVGSWPRFPSPVKCQYVFVNCLSWLSKRKQECQAEWRQLHVHVYRNCSHCLVCSPWCCQKQSTFRYPYCSVMCVAHWHPGNSLGSFLFLMFNVLICKYVSYLCFVIVLLFTNGIQWDESWQCPRPTNYTCTSQTLHKFSYVGSSIVHQFHSVQKLEMKVK